MDIIGRRTVSTGFFQRTSTRAPSLIPVRPSHYLLRAHRLFTVVFAPRETQITWGGYFSRPFILGASDCDAWENSLEKLAGYSHFSCLVKRLDFFAGRVNAKAGGFTPWWEVWDITPMCRVDAPEWQAMNGLKHLKIKSIGVVGRSPDHETKRYSMLDYATPARILQWVKEVSCDGLPGVGQQPEIRQFSPHAQPVCRPPHEVLVVTVLLAPCLLRLECR